LPVLILGHPMPQPPSSLSPRFRRARRVHERGELDPAAQLYADILRRDPTGPFRDETAAVIARLDAVIAVDTAVAHLAGAMGKPLFLLLPFGADFRWVRERSDSPW